MKKKVSGRLMKKIFLIIYSIFKIPFRIFTKVSPFVLIRNSKIHKDSAIFSYTRFYNSSIDKYSYIGRNCFINLTSIGKFCSISDNVCIGLASHPVDWVSTSPLFQAGRSIFRIKFAKHPYNSIAKTVIGNDVWVGINVSIKSGVKIGDGAIIGAGSIVTKDVEPYTIVGGNPARIIRKRFCDEKINFLLDLKWWEWEDNKISLYSDTFNDIDKFKELQQK